MCFVAEKDITPKVFYKLVYVLRPVLDALFTILV